MNINKTKYYLFVSLCLITIFTKGQNYKRFTVQDGLPSNKIYSQVFDQDGYLWLCTESGLSKFDGFRFKNYTTKDGLTDNDIVEIYVDSKNRLWLLSADNKLNVKDGNTFYNSDNCEWIPELSDLLMDLVVQNDTVYIGARGNLFKSYDSTLIKIKTPNLFISFIIATDSSLLLVHGDASLTEIINEKAKKTQDYLPVASLRNSKAIIKASQNTHYVLDQSANISKSSSGQAQRH